MPRCTGIIRLSLLQKITYCGVPVTALSGFSRVSRLQELMESSDLPVREEELWGTPQDLPGL